MIVDHDRIDLERPGTAIILLDTYPLTAEGYSRLRLEIAAALKARAFTEEAIDSIILGTGEVVANVIVHVKTASCVEVRICTSEMGCNILVRHNGQPSDRDWLSRAREQYQRRGLETGSPGRVCIVNGEATWLVDLKPDSRPSLGLGLPIIDQLFAEVRADERDMSLTYLAPVTRLAA